jgi:hypothetical protein
LVLLVVGKGRWGNTYVQTLKKLKIQHWQATHDWHCFNPDGVIVATPPETHYDIARIALARRIPVLVEKPVCLSSRAVEALVALGGIAFAGHTRLYAPAWRAFKETLPEVTHVEAWAGGTERNPWWDWGPHLVSMSFDIGFKTPVLHVTKERQPLRFVVNGTYEYTDVEGGLEVLVREFLHAIKNGKPDNRLMPEVIAYLETHEPR